MDGLGHYLGRLASSFGLAMIFLLPALAIVSIGVVLVRPREPMSSGTKSLLWIHGAIILVGILLVVVESWLHLVGRHDDEPPVQRVIKYTIPAQLLIGLLLAAVSRGRRGTGNLLGIGLAGVQLGVYATIDFTLNGLG